MLCVSIGHFISILSPVHFTNTIISIIFCRILHFSAQACYSVFYVNKYARDEDSLILWTQHSHSLMVLLFLLYYYLRRNTPLCKPLKIVPVIRTSFQLTCNSKNNHTSLGGNFLSLQGSVAPHFSIRIYWRIRLSCVQCSVVGLIPN